MTFTCFSMARLATRNAVASLLLAAIALTGFAGEGHNHGDATPTPAAGSASPRINVHSDLFELVGIVAKGEMTVYLDRYASNEPVAGAKIEYESGTEKGIAQPQPDGTYLIKFAALGKPGELPFSFTVTAGTDTDLLAGDLDIKDRHNHADEAAAKPWLRWAAYAAGALALLAAVAWTGRRIAQRRQLRLKD